MSNNNDGFLCGAFFGAIIGTVIGTLIAPRSGEETRAILADQVLDLRDKALDVYGEGMNKLQDRFEDVAPVMQNTTDDLRAKLELARRKMDEIRNNLSDSVSAAAENMNVQVEQFKRTPDKKTSAQKKDSAKKKITVKKATDKK